MTQPPYPPSAPPPPPPPYNPPPGAAPGAPNSNRTLMLVLSYVWILAIVPLLVEKDDKDVQWHAKHGLVLLAVEIVVYIVLGVLSMIPVIGCVIAIIPALVFIGFLIIRIMAIMKALNGERFLIPGLSDFANRF